MIEQTDFKKQKHNAKIIRSMNIFKSVFKFVIHSPHFWSSCKPEQSNIQLCDRKSPPPSFLKLVCSQKLFDTMKLFQSFSMVFLFLNGCASNCKKVKNFVQVEKKLRFNQVYAFLSNISSAQNENFHQKEPTKMQRLH